jgi:hypothetical protein
MSRLSLIGRLSPFFLVVLATTAFGLILSIHNSAASPLPQTTSSERPIVGKRLPYGRFEVDVIVNGRPSAEYYARGRTYVEALDGAEYELRIRNPLPERVAVALSVDGLNTIDASHTSAWNASKWVIEPYQTITISGWQVSTERARKFYFTNERDSYGAKLGQTANLGVIAAVFFRERIPKAITVRPPITRDDRTREQNDSAKGRSAEASQDRRGVVSPAPNDEYAATGIGRSVGNDVRWISMDLESQPAGEITLRYEYYSTLLRLGVVPQRPGEPYPLQRRENSRGFSPEP